MEKTITAPAPRWAEKTRAAELEQSLSIFIATNSAVKKSINGHCIAWIWTISYLYGLYLAPDIHKWHFWDPGILKKHCRPSVLHWFRLSGLWAQTILADHNLHFCVDNLSSSIMLESIWLLTKYLFLLIIQGNSNFTSPDSYLILGILGKGKI